MILPTDIYNKIFDYVDYSEYSNFILTCKKFNELFENKIKKDKFFDKYLYYYLEKRLVKTSFNNDRSFTEKYTTQPPNCCFKFRRMIQNVSCFLYVADVSTIHFVKF